MLIIYGGRRKLRQALQRLRASIRLSTEVILVTERFLDDGLMQRLSGIRVGYGLEGDCEIKVRLSR